MAETPCFQLIHLIARSLELVEQFRESFGRVAVGVMHEDDALAAPF
jgi:hypothetical protein